MSSHNQTPSDNIPETPGRYYGRRTEPLSSQLDPGSPSFARTPGSPSRFRNRRSELLSSTLLGDDIGATSPLAYPSTPLRSGLGSFDSPRTPRTTTFIRTPYMPQTPSNRMSSQANMDTQESDPSLPVRLIWGTTVNIHEAMTSFRNFLNNFTLAQRKRKLNEPINPQEDNQPFYPKLLAHVKNTGATNVNLDCRNLKAYHDTHKLHDQLIKYPQEIIPLMDHTITEFFLGLFPTSEDSIRLKVRPFNVSNTVNMRDLDPQSKRERETKKELDN